MIENFGRNVARLRKKMGMKQEDLAKELNVSKQTISSIERGERYTSFENLEKISKILKANAIQLFGTENEIAVSDTPVILDRIDEYSGKVQAVLKVEKILGDNSFWEAITDAAQIIETITDFTDDKTVTDEEGESHTVNKFNEIMSYHMKDMQEIIYMMDDIEGFIKGRTLTDEDGIPILDNNNNPRISKPVLESVPFDKIAKVREDIEFILANKDKV